MFSGGALEQLSIFALGIMPYVSASIILQLMTVVVQAARGAAQGGRGRPAQDQPVHALRHDRAQHRPEHGHRALLRGPATARTQYGDVVREPGWGFRLMTMITLTTGTAFIMWLGEQITERGIGNGISLIIFAGICADLPDALFRTATLLKTSESLQPVEPAARGRPSCIGIVCGHRASSSARSAASRSTTPSAWSAGRCTAARPRTCRCKREHGRRDPADLRVVAADVPGHAAATCNVPGHGRGCSERAARRATGAT